MPGVDVTKVYWRKARLDDLELEGDPDYHKLAVRSLVNNSTVVFVDEDGGFVGFAGILPMGEGVGEAWFSPSPLFLKRPRAALAVKDALETTIARTGVIRCQATVDADFEKGRRFAAYFGFKEEGLLRKYFRGKDHYMMARVK